LQTSYNFPVSSFSQSRTLERMKGILNKSNLKNLKLLSVQLQLSIISQIDYVKSWKCKKKKKILEMYCERSWTKSTFQKSYNFSLLNVRLTRVSSVLLNQFASIEISRTFTVSKTLAWCQHWLKYTFNKRVIEESSLMNTEKKLFCPRTVYYFIYSIENLKNYANKVNHYFSFY
jgi:hypothetical protein